LAGAGNPQGAYASFNGNLMFLAGQYRIYDHLGNPVTNSEKIYQPNYSVCLQSSENSWDLLGAFHPSDVQPFIENTLDYYCAYNNCYDSLKYLEAGFYRNQFMRDSNNRGYISKKMEKVDCDISTLHLRLVDMKRSFDYNYNLLGIRTENPMKQNQKNSVTLLHFSYENGTLNVLDSFVFSNTDFLPNHLVPLLKNGTHIQFGFLNLSRNRDKVFGSLNIGVEGYFDKERYDKIVFFELDLDPRTGKFISAAPKILFEKLNQTMPAYIKNTDTIINFNYDAFALNDACSPNDSVLYFYRSKEFRENGIVNKKEQEIMAWRFRAQLLSEAKTIYKTMKLNPNSIYSSYSTINSPNINPFGGMSFIFEDRGLDSNEFIHYSDANEPFNAKMVSQKMPWTYFYKPILHLYDYLRAKDTVVYKDCGAYVNIRNKSDLSNGLSNFKWYVAKNTQWTEWDSFNTFDLPTQFFTQSGKYLFKLHGSSQRGSGYSEWYVDTLHIEIPKKPIADFYASDSVLCQYTQMKFHNYSRSTELIKETYLWDFGDGNTSESINPVHEYKEPGEYTISLWYQNGYCDSKLVKRNYIRVVDAPEPGFTVSSTQGCAPHKVQFIDTVTLNVSQKDYYFSDIKDWENINLSSNQFTHTFQKAGVFWAIQRLTGYNGCVIMQDSIQFNISKGLTSYDTLNTVIGTVLNNKGISDLENRPSINWHKLDAAVNYQLFKNNLPYKITNDTFLLDDVVYDRDIEYSVAGIDSCGNLSSTGTIAKPIYLQIKMLGQNDAAEIVFSPYRKWKNSLIQYEIQKIVDKQWQTIDMGIENTVFTDHQFLNLNQVEACYRIHGFDSKDTNLNSNSNIVCLPYIPTIYIPDAFSPNDDGYNDVFEVKAFGINKYQIIVYNRWGELVFLGKAMQAWDGKGFPEGVYVINVEYTTNTGLHLRHRGTLTLLK
jgi:gliding motility-associated-like protein